MQEALTVASTKVQDLHDPQTRLFPLAHSCVTYCILVHSLQASQTVSDTEEQVWETNIPKGQVEHSTRK